MDPESILCIVQWNCRAHGHDDAEYGWRHGHPGDGANEAGHPDHCRQWSRGDRIFNEGDQCRGPAFPHQTLFGANPRPAHPRGPLRAGHRRQKNAAHFRGAALKGNGSRLTSARRRGIPASCRGR